ncbi:MAG: hypothetical protein L0241_04175 [Planctomycetia bacterium]|nr:hypothetical protein [Planctomycetia bacterium]
MASTKPPSTRWWEPVWELVVHVFVGSFLFAVIAIPAVAIDLGVTWIKKTLEPSEFLVDLLTVVKYIVALIDALHYVVFLIGTAVDFVIKISHPRDEHAQ